MIDFAVQPIGRRVPRSRQRGGAMLIALVAVLLIAPTLATIAAVGAQQRWSARAHAHRMSALALLASSHAIVDRWLMLDSGRVLLPIDQPAPSVTIAHLLLRPDARTGRPEVELRIQAIDQWGLPSLDTVASNAAWSASAPADALQQFQSTSGAPASPLGLDVLNASRAGRPVFPRRLLGSDTPPADLAHGTAADLSLAELIATHNPLPSATADRRAARAPVNINLATAPLRTIDAAERATGLSLSRAIRAQRARQLSTYHPRPLDPSLASPPSASQPVPPSPPGTAPAVHFTTQSGCWSFRIDARVGPVVRSQWRVHALIDGSWQPVQTIEIVP